MADKSNLRTVVRFTVPFSKEVAFYRSLVFINTDLETIDVYRDVLHTRVIVHLAFLPSLSREQCQESYRRFYDYTDIFFEDVCESDSDSES